MDFENKYQIDPEQLGSLQLDDSETNLDLEGDEDNVEITDSVEDTHEFETDDEGVTSDDEEVVGEDDTTLSNLHKVKVDGEEVEVDYDELLNGYSRQSDYTKKTQNLAEREREMESEKLVWEQTKTDYELKIQAFEQKMEQTKNLYQMFDDFTRDPNFARAVQEYYEYNRLGDLPNQQTQVNPDIARLEQQLKEQQERWDAQEQQRIQEQEYQEAVREWEGLLKQYPDAETKQEQIWQHAENEGLNLRAAYRDLYFEEIQKNAQKETVNAIKKRKSKTITNTKGNSDGGTKGDPIPKGYGNVVQHLLGKDLNLFD